MIIFTILGIVSSVFQLVVFREFTFSIAKNELSFVLAAGMWLVFSSLGSILARKRQFISPLWLGPSIAIVFCLALALIHLSKEWFGLAYFEAASLVFVLISAAVFIGMVSFTMGYLFGAFSSSYLKRSGLGEGVHARFFAWEAAGFFIGGVIFSFCLSNYINPFLFSFLALFLTLGFLLPAKNKLISTSIVIITGVLFSLAFPAILTKEFRGAKIDESLGSHYGPIFVTDASGAKTIYTNGSLTASSEDTSWNEAFIHTSMAAVPKASNVLYIGAYASGQVEEILKYENVQLDCLEINPVLSDLSKRKIPKALADKVNFIIDDPRAYIARGRKKYDLILMNMPAPSSVALNRYFTVEFFASISQRLKSEGVFSFFIPSKTDILSPQILKFDSCIVNTAQSVFKHTLLIPGDSMLILAAQGINITSSQIIHNYSEHAPRTDYFTVYHLKDYLDAGRIAYIRNMIDRKIMINRDLSPWGFLYYLLMEQRKFYPNLVINVMKLSRAIVIIGLFLIMAIGLMGLIRGRLSTLLNVSTLGFISIGITALVFLLFQLYSGALFWKMGILIGLFMAGLSIGTFFINRMLKDHSATRGVGALLFFIWALFGVSMYLGVRFFSDAFREGSIFFLYAFLAGVLTGSGYPIFTRRMLAQTKIKNVAVSVYAADLMGAFFGTLIFSIFVIPFLGISGAIAAVIFIAVVFSIKSIFA